MVGSRMFVSEILGEYPHNLLGRVAEPLTLIFADTIRTRGAPSLAHATKDGSGNLENGTVAGRAS